MLNIARGSTQKQNVLHFCEASEFLRSTLNSFSLFLFFKDTAIEENSSHLLQNINVLIFTMFTEYNFQQVVRSEQQFLSHRAVEFEAGREFNASHSGR